MHTHISIHPIRKLDNTVNRTDENETAGSVEGDEETHPVLVSGGVAAGGLGDVAEVAGLDVEADPDDGEEAEGDELDAEADEDDEFSLVDGVFGGAGADFGGSDALSYECNCV